MEFLNGQESLSGIQWILRALLTFIFLLFATKLIGERSISQLRLIDFTIAIILGNVVAQPLADEKLGMQGAFITTTVLILLYVIAVWLNLKITTFRKWFEPSPFPLIKNGEIIYDGLKKAKITIDHLMSGLRKSQIDEVQKVALAQWEPDGTISFFLSPQHKPLTPHDIHLVQEPFPFVSIIVREGKLNNSNLEEIGKDKTWLVRELVIMHIEIHDILLATLNDKGELKVYLYK